MINAFTLFCFCKGAVRYFITVTSEDTDDDVVIPSAVTTRRSTVTIENLTHGTAYLFRVRSIGSQDQRSAQSVAVQQIIGKFFILQIRELLWMAEFCMSY